MNAIWTYIDSKGWTGNQKSAAVLTILGALSAVAGFAVWMVVRTWTLSTTDWMLCFIGYPVYFSWITAFLYSCTHEFKNVSPYTLSYEE